MMWRRAAALCGGWSLSVVAGLLLAVSVLAASLPESWPLEALSHFRIQYAVAALIVLLWGTFRFAFISAGAGLIALILNLIVLIPYFPIRSDSGPSLGGARIVKVTTINLFEKQSALDTVAGRTFHNPPDLLVLAEVPVGSEQTFSRIFPTLPHVYSVGEEDKGRIHVLSAVPAEAVDILSTPGRTRNAIKARICGAGIALLPPNADGSPSTAGAGCLTLYALHPGPPWTESELRRRDLFLTQVAQDAGQTDGPRLIVGDLNTTPWGPIFKEMVALSGLRDSGLRRGVRTTWGASVLPFNVLRLPIDHILISSDIKVLDRMIGASVGSDHVPVTAVLALPD